MADPSQSDAILANLIAGRVPSRPDPGVLGNVPGRAAAHGLSAFVLQRVREGTLALPPQALALLEADAHRARRLRTVLDLELSRLGRAAPTDIATPMLLKGPAVARYWPRPELRTHEDIDLLVPEADLDAWDWALRSLGYAGPGDAEARTARLGHHHLVYRREPAVVELHWRLFAAREARLVGHAVLAKQAAPVPRFGGFLAATQAAQLVVLAVHLAHHRPQTRKLVWLLDFVFLGEPEPVRAARALADVWRVRWALEGALADAEAVLGRPRWGATPEALGGLAAARRTDAGRVRTALAKARMLGIRDSIRYARARAQARRDTPE